MEELQSRLHFVKNAYFIRNRGVIRHTDKQRTCVISFELSNPENAGTNMYSSVDADGVLDETINYNGRTIMWNTFQPHQVNDTEADRIFFQLELERNLLFKDYKRIYEDGNLIVAK